MKSEKLVWMQYIVRLFHFVDICQEWDAIYARSHGHWSRSSLATWKMHIRFMSRAHLSVQRIVVVGLSLATNHFIGILQLNIKQTKISNHQFLAICWTWMLSNILRMTLLFSETWKLTRFWVFVARRGSLVQVFVVAENIVVEAPGLPSAVDKAFKLHYICDIQYEPKNTWQLIQNVVFEVHVQWKSLKHPEYW